MCSKNVSPCPFEKLFKAYMKHLDCEVAVFVEAFVRALEAAFACERVYQVEFSPHHYSACGFFCFLYVEVAVVKAEKIHIFGKKTKESNL